MLFGPQRGSAFTIFDKFASTFGLPIVVVLLALIFRNTAALLENGVVLVVVLIAPVSRLLKYLFTYYSIDEEKFHVKSGLFNKKTLEIPLDRITTVDFTQNLIFQWLGVYSIKVDNASNYGGNGAGKVELALKKADALKMKELLLSKRSAGGSMTGADHRNATSDEKENGFISRQTGKGETSAYRLEDGSIFEMPADDSITAGAGSCDMISVIPAKKILLMGALQSKGNAVAQVISMLAVLGSMGNIIAGKELGFEDKMIDFILSIPGIGLAAILVVSFIILSTLLGSVFALIKYYGFRIRDGEESIFLEYGLFTKKNHSLLKEKISGVEFVQSIPMRLFKVGYLNVLAVGYGDMDSGSMEKAMMYPLIAEAYAGVFVSKYIPEIEPASEYEKPPKSSLRYFFLCPRFFMALIIVGAAVVAELIWGFVESCPIDIGFIWVLLGLMVVVAVISVITEYGNTGVCAGDKNVHLVSGGFTRIKTVVKTAMIESVSDKGSLLKRRKRIVTIQMGIMAPALDSIKIVRNMHLQAFESIKNVIHY